MKKQLISVPLFLLLMVIANAQNLVPNPSFENYFNSFCGIMQPADFNLTIMDWKNPTNASTSAYFTNIDSSCYNFQPDSQYPGPIGIKGTQLPRTGNVFAGIWVYTIDGLNQRQYLQVELDEPLETGKTYAVSYYVSLADFIESSINSLGVHFSTMPVQSSGDTLLDVVPQLVDTNFVEEIIDWVLVSDTITADENYRFLTIGNFNNDSTTMTQANPSASNEPGTYGAYYFVDDVSVSEIVLTGMEDLWEEKVKVFPNPVKDKVTIQVSEKSKNLKVKIFNLQGMSVFTQSFDNESIMAIDCSVLTAGVYFLQIENGSENYVQKLMKF